MQAKKHVFTPKGVACQYKHSAYESLLTTIKLPPALRRAHATTRPLGTRAQQVLLIN